VSHRIRGFDGIRALAVLAVFVGHRTPLHATQIGHAGVLAFFALSGFLIVGILRKARVAIEIGTGSFAGAFSRFFTRRTRRIFPIYYLTLAALVILASIGRPVVDWRWDALPWHLVYLSNVYEGHVLQAWQGSLTHLWSLAVEEQFYLLAAPLLLLLPSRFHLAACSAVVALGIASHTLVLATGANAVAVFTDSLTNFGVIALGGALCLAAELGRLQNAGKAVLPLSAGLAMLALFPSDALTGTWLFVTPFVAGALVLAVSQAQRSRLVALLELPPLAYLGRVSYGFYLFHNLFWIGAPFDGPLGVLFSAAANFAATLAIATATWFTIEKPLLRDREPARQAALA
jgi:peptidoglycan/LPS O-acetylase OafA/YrhL